MIKKLLKEIANFVRKVFGDLFDLLEEKAPLAVKITQDLKESLEDHGGKVEWILDKTATEKDDEAYEFVKNKLPKIAKQIAVIDGLVDENATDEEAYEIYVAFLLSKKKEGRAKEFIFLAAQILGMIIGKKAPIDLLVTMTQRAYRLIFKKDDE